MYMSEVCKCVHDIVCTYAPDIIGWQGGLFARGTYSVIAEGSPALWARGA
jgi:hypothetical protein